jgi:phenylacetate-CoA ligase
MYPELSEAERFPLLTPRGRALLHAMRQDPQAPRWNWPNGEQLDAKGLERVERFAHDLNAPHPAPAEWVQAYADFCVAEVPFYRRRTPGGTPFAVIPTCSRADLAARVWDFVPDSEPLDDLIVFSSSGTTGHPAQIPFHPSTAAAGIPLLERALAGTGVAFPRGPDHVALTHIAAYRGAYTTAIVIAYLREAGCVRVNLHPEVWNHPHDCRTYLDRYAAPVMLGDPQAFESLAGVRIERPPRAMVSSIAHLSDALSADLTRRYGCPVLDVYALTEAGIVAVRTPQGHAVLPHDLHVEVLDEHDQPVPDGGRGEVVLTGGRNPYLPLLRYRTGDFAALARQAGRPVLIELEGRRPVVFPVGGDRVVHCMEVTRLLRRFPFSQYQLHQDEDGGFRFSYRGHVSEDEFLPALHELLSHPRTFTVETLSGDGGTRRKVDVYRSDREPVPSSVE